MPDPGDVGEDAAASRIAKAVAGLGLTTSAAFTGRVNLFASARGLCVVDVERLNRLNLIDESATVATLPAFAPVEPRQMVATIKIIPFAAPEAVVAAAEALAAEGDALIRVAEFQPLRTVLIQTWLAGTKVRARQDRWRNARPVGGTRRRVDRRGAGRPH